METNGSNSRIPSTTGIEVEVQEKETDQAKGKPPAKEKGSPRTKERQRENRRAKGKTRGDRIVQTGAKELELAPLEEGVGRGIKAS